MNDTIAKALLTALQGVFRKHAKPVFYREPFNFPPEWEAARVAIKAAVERVE